MINKKEKKYKIRYMCVWCVCMFFILVYINRVSPAIQFSIAD